MLFYNTASKASVFLPAAGYRKEGGWNYDIEDNFTTTNQSPGKLISAGAGLVYWTRTRKASSNDSEGRKAVSFTVLKNINTGAIHTKGMDNENYTSNAFSVRCVKD